MEEKKVAEQKPQVPVQARSKKWILGLVGGVFFVLVALVVFLPQPYYTEGFKTLSELQEYAKTIDENIKMDGKNIFFPSYESYYRRKFEASFLNILKDKINWILYKCRCKVRPYFSSSFFRTLLIDVLSCREQKNLNGIYVQKINLTESSKIVVFGVVQGAFHSLVRDLSELKNLGILDENLRVLQADYHLVFLGNVINRSPYTLETLSIVLRLLEENPDNVVYLKGTNEFFDYWKLHTLQRELELRLKNYSVSSTPLEREVCDFFDSLPVTLYCLVPTNNINSLDYFKVFPFIQDEKILSMLGKFNYYNFLTQSLEKQIATIQISDIPTVVNQELNSQKLVLRANVGYIKKRQDYELMDGLRLLDTIDGVTTWTVLSSPTESFRIGWNFFYDAFSVIAFDQKLKTWTISLRNRDIRNNNLTFKRSDYHFFSGQSVA